MSEITLYEQLRKHKQMEKFIYSLLDPEMFGHAVSAEVRDEARKVLGMKPVETIKKES